MSHEEKYFLHTKSVSRQTLEKMYPKDSLASVRIKIKSITHRLKRYFLARPRLYITREGYYMLAYHWLNGTIEVVEEGFVTHGGIIKVLAMTEVIYEVIP